MGDCDFEIHSTGSFRIVEQPANIVSAVLKRDMDNGTLTKRNSPSNNSVFNSRRRNCLAGNGHFNVRSCSEERCSHSTPVVPILGQDPLANSPLSIIMSSAEPRVIPRLLECVVQI